jgi:polar amino acid transport system permease protein
MAGSTKKIARIPARIIIEFFRGTSLLVQLMWLFYVLPLFGPSLGAMAVAIFALTLNYGAYGAEAVRASLTSVPQGQWEATTALSMSWPHKIRRVIFPQAWALMLPSLTNLWVHLLKGSSIVYIIGMSEFTFELLQLRRTTDWFFALAVVGLIVYFLIALVLTQLMQLLEARAKHRLGQGPSLKEILSPVPKVERRPAESAATSGGGQ